ncbi:MAG: hypothetical protein ACETWM_06750 [Candidatus Lokiarchaeia archaeon]
MTTTKRKIYKVLKWTAIITGLASTFFGLLLGYNANIALQNISSINYQWYLPPDQSKFFMYDGIAYEFNAIAIAQVQFPNGTIIDSKVDYILWPYELTIPLKSNDPTEILLGLSANIFFLDVNMNVPPEAEQWAIDNGKPLNQIGIFIVWFNLPIGGFNAVITPVLLFYWSPYIFTP